MMYVERVKVWFRGDGVRGPLCWAVTGGWPTPDDPKQRRVWRIQPSGRTACGVRYGASIATFFRRKDAEAFARELRQEGPPTYAMVERSHA